MLPPALFLQLALSCAPTVASETMAAVANAESSLDPLVLHDNDTGRSFHPNDVQAANALAKALIEAGHSIDIGLMQINSRNLDRLGLSVASALQPCSSLAAGAQILTKAYQPVSDQGGQQRALRIAFSRYNTGNSDHGFANGYVHRVEVSAAQIVPAIRLAPDTAPPSTHVAPRLQSDSALAGAHWDVWGANTDGERPLVWSGTTNVPDASLAGARHASFNPR